MVICGGYVRIYIVGYTFIAGSLKLSTTLSIRDEF